MNCHLIVVPIRGTYAASLEFDSTSTLPSSAAEGYSHQYVMITRSRIVFGSATFGTTGVSCAMH